MSRPALLATLLVIELFFRGAIWSDTAIENFIRTYYAENQRDKMTERLTKKRMKTIRGAFGWFRDMAASLQGVVAEGTKFYQYMAFNILRIIGYGRVQKSLFGLPNPLYSEEQYILDVKDLDVGGGDSGFVTLMYGFAVFFLCICLAPATCFGVWIQWPVFFGTLPTEQAWWLVNQCAPKIMRQIAFSEREPMISIACAPAGGLSKSMRW